MKENIFKVRIKLTKLFDAGIITIESPNEVGISFTVNPGSPFQSAYNEAFSLALSTQLPLWFDDILLYDPDIKDVPRTPEDE